MLERIIMSIKEIIGLRTRRTAAAEHADRVSCVSRNNAHDAIHELLTEITTTTNKENSKGGAGEKSNK